MFKATSHRFARLFRDRKSGRFLSCPIIFYTKTWSFFHLNMPSSSSPLLDVLSNACLAHLITGFTYVLIPPSRLMRYPFFLIILVFIHRAVISTRPINGIGDQISTYLCGFALYAHYYLIVIREIAPPVTSSLEQLSNVAAFYFSPRRKLSAGRIPSFSASDPKYVPSRLAFIFAGIRRLLFAFAFIHFQRNYSLNTIASDYGPPRDRLLSRILTFSVQNPNDKISVIECIIRVYITLTVLAMEYNIHNLVHTSASIIGVGLLRHSPSQWPPIYGPLKEAYTVRRFYGIFYHSLMRNAFVGNAAWLVDPVLFWGSHSTITNRVISPRKSFVRKWLINLVALAICGMMHSVALSTADGCPPGYFQMRYYLYILVGMLVEDSMFWLFKQLRPRPLHQDRIGFCLRFCGYLWVFLFHFWMIPNSLYPNLFCEVELQLETAI